VASPIGQAPVETDGIQVTAAQVVGGPVPGGTDDDNEVDSVGCGDQVTDLVAAVRGMGDFRAGDVEGPQVVREPQHHHGQDRLPPRPRVANTRRRESDCGARLSAVHARVLRGNL
jgi:hypothetical protein